MNKINPFFSKNIAIIIKFDMEQNAILHHFTCISNTWYLITVPDINKINPFVSWISQQAHMYEKVAIITQIWQSQMLFYNHKQCTVPDNCTTYEQNHHILLQDNTINTQNLWRNSHYYSNLAQSQIVFYVNEQPLVPDHGTQYKENPASHNVGMHEDELIEG